MENVNGWSYLFGVFCGDRFSRVWIFQTSGYFKCYFLQFFDVYMCYFYVEIVFVGGLDEGKRMFVFSSADFSLFALEHPNVRE